MESGKRVLRKQVVDVRNEQILEAIEGYLSRHPEAADTLQGISKWWVPEMGLEVSEAEVADALEHRPEDSPIKEQKSLSGPIIYRLRDAELRGREDSENA